MGAAETSHSVPEELRVDIVWDGITQPESLHEEAAQIRHALADAAKTYNWPRVFELLSEHKDPSLTFNQSFIRTSPERFREHRTDS